VRCAQEKHSLGLLGNVGEMLISVGLYQSLARSGPTLFEDPFSPGGTASKTYLNSRLCTYLLDDETPIAIPNEYQAAIPFLL